MAASYCGKMLAFLTIVALISVSSQQEAAASTEEAHCSSTRPIELAICDLCSRSSAAVSMRDCCGSAVAFRTCEKIVTELDPFSPDALAKRPYMEMEKRRRVHFLGKRGDGLPDITTSLCVGKSHTTSVVCSICATRNEDVSISNCCNHGDDYQQCERFVENEVLSVLHGEGSDWREAFASIQKRPRVHFLG